MNTRTVNLDVPSKGTLHVQKVPYLSPIRPPTFVVLFSMAHFYRANVCP